MSSAGKAPAPVTLCLRGDAHSDPVMGQPNEPEYILGTGADELERLGLQHRMWSDAAHVAWKRAGLVPGARVLDVGAGPGYASFDLAQIVQRAGAVVAVDESRGFIEHLNEQARARRLPQLGGRVGDAQRLESVLAGEAPFDFAYARWVLCFVPDPGAVVAGVARALRSGGRFVVHDYFNYAAMTVAPRRESYTKIVQATARSWRARGGDPDVGARLPRLLAEQGFAVEHLAAHQRIARPGDSMFAWVDSWWRNYTPKLAQMGEITDADARAFFADFDALRAESDFVSLPAVYEIIAQKR